LRHVLIRQIASDLVQWLAEVCLSIAGASVTWAFVTWAFVTWASVAWMSVAWMSVAWMSVVLLPVGTLFGAETEQTVRSSGTFSSNKNQIVIAADQWCPYNCDDQSRYQGFMIDVTREVLGAGGYTVIYVNQSWADALADVSSGRRDAVVGASVEEARGLRLAAEPLGSNQTCFYTRPDDPFQYRSGMSLHARRVGLTYGYLYGDIIDSYVTEHRHDSSLVQLVTGRKPLLLNLEKLRARRVDTIIENAMVMEFSLRKYQWGELRRAGCDEPSTLHIAFSPARADAGRLAELMNQGIRALRKSGRMQDILSRYGVQDWK
jgi:polar amino acid transport system substrate-binding protein